MCLNITFYVSDNNDLQSETCLGFGLQSKTPQVSKTCGVWQYFRPVWCPHRTAEPPPKGLATFSALFGVLTEHVRYKNIIISLIC